MLAITILWMVIALTITGVILSAMFARNAERNFQGLLLAHTYNLMGAIDVDEFGKITGSPNLGDPRFLAPLSGWYWAVAKAAEPDIAIIHSDSLVDKQLSPPDTESHPFDPSFRRTYAANGAQLLDAQLFVGESEDLFQVTVAGDRTELERSISEFRKSLFAFFAIFGLVGNIATYFVIRIGMAPLNKAASNLARIRKGEASEIDGAYPNEVQPLVGEINALLEANSAVIERSRTQVGNLAHALKTPLAVVLNEANAKKTAGMKVIRQQIGTMQDQIQTYLDRARIAANVGTINANTNVPTIVNRVLRVMQKLSPDLIFENEIDESLIFFGEAQDLEEVLGNLLENASKFANSRVRVSVRTGKEADNTRTIELFIEDDGPGVEEANMHEMLKRGVRLDETKPGSGLGLSIVRDITTEYGGKLELQRSKLGGLQVSLTLPGGINR